MTAETALARLHEGDPAGALAEVARSMADKPTDPACHATQGMALLAQDRPADALAALRIAVALGEASPVTLLNLAIAEDRAGDRDRARGLMRSIAERLPDWDEPLVRLAESLRAADEWPAAEIAYREALDRNPRRQEALIALSGLLIASGRAADARSLLLRCCGIDPGRAETWDTLGLALLATDEAPLALTAFIEAQRLAPAALSYALHGVEAACLANAIEPELARLDLAVTIDPLNAVRQTARGVLLARLGQRDAAIDALEVAVALAPDAAQPIAFLGGVLAHANRLREAEAALRRASQLDPANPRLRNDRAAVLMRMHRHPEARTILLDLVAETGEQGSVMVNLANATACVGLQAEAVALARRAIALDPDSVLARRTLCNTLPYLDGIDGATLLAALRDCSDRLPRVPMPALLNGPDPDRKLVVGLLSGVLKTHPVGWLTIAGFEALDPTQFSLVCLVQNGMPGDQIGRRFHAVARDWIEIDMLDDRAVAQAARDRGVDVLIDLGGYGDAGRMPACVHRLAPVQIKWVGMQNHSSGVAEMDWILTDRWETPPVLAPHYSERLLCLPDGYVCYSPPPYAPDVVPLPALRNGYVTFGCFNNLAKVTPVVIETWAEILDRLPDSRLVLKTHQFSDGPTAARIGAAFEALGIDRTRIALRGASGHRAFLREYGDIDIVLDPFPYSGGLTTCEAIWMGVPTVSMPGEIFASRHSLSHLSNVGLTDWIAPDLAGYVDLALEKAADLEALATLRATLRARAKASPLCDAARFGRNLGAALRHAWQDWCTRQ
ncbi:MAG: tetratricopeptide repeat protein [Acetobacteraceae bacterium]|nr:tetratricopeptide repeat protein [Acetobacteraceae bacterium]